LDYAGARETTPEPEEIDLTEATLSEPEPFNEDSDREEKETKGPQVCEHCEFEHQVGLGLPDCANITRQTGNDLIPMTPELHRKYMCSDCGTWFGERYGHPDCPYRMKMKKQGHKGEEHPEIIVHDPSCDQPIFPHQRQCRKCGVLYDQGDDHEDCTGIANQSGPPRKTLMHMTLREDIRLCFQCGEFGHKGEQCPSVKKEVTKRCYYCREWGHEIQECPETKEARQKKENSRKSSKCLVCHETGHEAPMCKKIKERKEKDQQKGLMSATPNRKRSSSSDETSSVDSKRTDRRESRSPIMFVPGGITTYRIPKKSAETPTMPVGRPSYIKTGLGYGETSRFGSKKDRKNENENTDPTPNERERMLKLHYTVLRTIVEKRWWPRHALATTDRRRDYAENPERYLPQILTVIFDSSGVFSHVDSSEYYVDLGYQAILKKNKKAPAISNQNKRAGMLTVNIRGFQPGTQDPIHFQQENEMLGIMNTLSMIHHLHKTAPMLTFYFVLGHHMVMKETLGEEEVFQTYFHWIDKHLHPKFQGKAIWMGTGRVGPGSMAEKNIRNIQKEHDRYLSYITRAARVTYDDWWKSVPRHWVKPGVGGEVNYPHSVGLHTLFVEYMQKHHQYAPHWSIQGGKLNHQKMKNSIRNRNRREREESESENGFRSQEEPEEGGQRAAPRKETGARSKQGASAPKPALLPSPEEDYNWEGGPKRNGMDRAATQQRKGPTQPKVTAAMMRANRQQAMRGRNQGPTRQNMIPQWQNPRNMSEQPLRMGNPRAPGNNYRGPMNSPNVGRPVQGNWYQGGMRMEYPSGYGPGVVPIGQASYGPHAWENPQGMRVQTGSTWGPGGPMNPNVYQTGPTVVNQTNQGVLVYYPHGGPSGYHHY